MTDANQALQKAGALPKTAKTNKSIFTNNPRWAENLGIMATTTIVALVLIFTVPNF